jgi:hypothetical protein
LNAASVSSLLQSTVNLERQPKRKVIQSLLMCHLPLGTVVGTSDTQTLTNKTTDNASKLNGASFGTAAQATAQCDGLR